MNTLKLSVLLVACCNSIFVFQGLILRLHDVPNPSHDVPNNVFLCVWCNCRGNVNLNCVFFYLGNERFLHFFILTSTLQ